MGKRLAQSGYAVLVVNPFYRNARSPVVPEGSVFQDPAIRELVMPMARALTPEVQFRDAEAYIGWLDRQSAVDTGRRVGTIGYCMGGPLVFRTAAAVPDRVGAVGSFHGGGLLTENENSPHLLLPTSRADYLVAIAENDHERDPQVKDALIQAFADAGLSAEVEVYPALHGWCPPDSAVYDEEQAERAWSRMLALFERALA
jgi:carboxymethylenebutenolidase